MIRNPSEENDTRAKNSIQLARRLWRDYLGKYWPKLAISLIAMALYAVSASLIPAGVEAINAALTGDESSRSGALLRLDPTKAAIWGPLIVIILGGTNAASQYVQTRLSATAALAALRDLQSDVYRAFLTVDDAQLRSIGQGQAAARLTTDSMALRETLTRASTALRDGLTLIGLLGVMLYYDWALFLVVFVVYPVLGWPVTRIGQYLRKRSREAQEQAGEIATLGIEAVAGGRLIRSYNLEDHMAVKADRAFEDRFNVLRRMAHLRALNEPFIFFVGSIALGIIVSVVAVRIEAGALNISELVSFIIALLLLSQPARGLSTLNAVAQEGFGALERMLGVVDMTPTLEDLPDAHHLIVKAGNIEFEDIVFRYAPGTLAAVDGVSLRISGGETVALVGESGAGKSTLITLLQRLYAPSSGGISIDGSNIQHVTIESLRRAIAIVSQETILFNGSIEENIRFGLLSAAAEDVVSAAKAAAAHDFIEASPEGYQTSVGEAGQSLSGGQRQRIAIARAFLKDAPILLLDEATSALDAETERQIQEALAQLRQNRTTIVIAHRLSTVVEADRIVLIDRGKIAAEGTHKELMAASEKYEELVRIQLRG
ncbi:MAG: ABC transporter ATP-binding protein [Pseudomonadota bacterium]